LHDVVVVTINYRLGALGFLALDDDALSSGLSCNIGLLDQMLALKWVQENISAFGGDPSRVCIFGESAGAMSVATLLGAPGAKGLFSTAIVQSGNCHSTQEPLDARATSGRFLKSLGVPINGAIETLRTMSTESLLGAQEQLAGSTPLPFRFVLDGEIVPVAPIESIALGQMSSVPILIGTNTDENTLFRRIRSGPGIFVGDLAERLRALVADGVDSRRCKQLVGELVDLYGGMNGNADDIWDVVMTDRMWRAPAREMMDAHTRAGGTVYAYEFSLPSPARGGEFGSCHAMEIPFVFGNLDQRGVNEFVGDKVGPGTPGREVSERMNRSWAEFARDGAPGGPDGSKWIAHTEEIRMQMCFGATTYLREDPHSERIAWWLEHSDEIIPWGRF
jgi:para-nitrobenzyl esterase